MSNLGFIEQLLDNTNHFYKQALNQFDWYKKILGTKVQVTRVSKDSDYMSVYGSIANSTLPDDLESESFNYVVLISMNDMKRLYQKSTDPMQFYDNKDILKLGDILSFSRGKQTYKWKITEVMTFSETADVLHQYTITGLTEVNTGIG
jgi:hypothetical protein